MRKILMVISVLAAFAMVILNLAYDDRIKPDAVYQMSNQHIEWTYAGK